MTRSFFKIFFLLSVLSLGACTVTVRAPSVEVNSPYIQSGGGVRVIAQHASNNYAGQQYGQSQQQPDHAAACRQRGGTGGFRVVNGNQIQCEPGNGGQSSPHQVRSLPYPVPAGDPRYVHQQGGQQQQAASAGRAGFPCRFLQGQTCY